MSSYRILTRLDLDLFLLSTTEELPAPKKAPQKRVPFALKITPTSTSVVDVPIKLLGVPDDFIGPLTADQAVAMAALKRIRAFEAAGGDARIRPKSKPIARAKTVVRSPEVVRIQDIPVLDYELVSNPISVADVYRFTIDLRYLPIPLDWIDSMRIQFWQVPKGGHTIEGGGYRSYPDESQYLKVGGEGYYMGIVDTIDRDHLTGTIRLECRDLSAILIDAKVPRGFVESLDTAKPIVDIMTSLLDSIPGAENWKIIFPVSDSGDKSFAYRAFVQSFEYLTGGSGFDVKQLRLHNNQTSPKKALQEQMKASKKAGSVAIEDFIGGMVDPGTTDTLSVWDVITKIATLGLMVPSITVFEKNPVLTLVSAEDHHLGYSALPFFRAGKLMSYRTLAVTKNIGTLKEKRKLASGGLSDIVTLFSLDAKTGNVISSSYGFTGRVPLSKEAYSTKEKQKSASRLAQIVPGKVSQKKLDTLAKVTWHSMRKSELEVTVTIEEPWTIGGHPGDMDLLYATAGQAVLIDTTNLDQWARTLSPEQMFTRAGFPPAVAQQLSDFGKTTRGTMLFQIQTISQGINRAGGYRCTLSLRTFLNVRPKSFIPNPDD